MYALTMGRKFLLTLDKINSRDTNAVKIFLQTVCCNIEQVLYKALAYVRTCINMTIYVW
jgi:hypothetical protein